MKLASLLLIASGLVTIISVSASPSWYCPATMVATEFARLQAWSTLKASASFNSALDYQLMVSESCSLFAELPCWARNNSIFLQGSTLQEAFASANATLFDLRRNPDANLLKGANRVATTGFWMSYLAFLVLTAHEPVCSATTSGGLVTWAGSSMALSALVQSVGMLLPRGELGLHPVAASEAMLQRLGFLAASLGDVDVAGLDVGNTNFTAWTVSATELCETEVAPLKGQVLTTAQVLALRARLQRQLALGGRRLATLMVQYF